MQVKLTKYPQSCLLVEVGEVRLLIDPGSFAAAAHDAATFGALDAVLYTHRHADHFDPGLLTELSGTGTRVVTNADVAAVIDGIDVETLGDRAVTQIAGVRLQAYDIPHCVMVDGSPGPPNTGFVIGDTLLHTGDGLDVPTEVEVLAVPIAGPSVSMRDAYRMVERSEASTVIPVHYDAFIANPEQFAAACSIAEVRVLADGEATTVR